MISDAVDISHRHCYGLDQLLLFISKFDMWIAYVLRSAISCAQCGNERRKYSTPGSTSISGNNIRTTMSIKYNKLCPVCKIGKYLMSESMGNVHLNQFLA